MRRKITLYIGNRLADLDDQSFVLFNHTMDDLSNPTVVKNSFSQQITLKGTPANNRIFGDPFRTDRRVSWSGGDTGADFNASRKTPFVIYNERSEILESGYVKLDSVTKHGADIQYKVTLYGGLGSFFYALSYDDNGNKRTLADLDYLKTGDPESELTFTIDAATVQEAWDRLDYDYDAPEMWDVINFAPAYNGIPDGDFSPDKALALPSDVGLRDSIPSGGVTYETKSGYALFNLAEPQDEWAVKDLRSYMQRPVLSMAKFWEAICDPDNNGGYEVDADVVWDSLKFGHYTNLWMTLPMIPSIGTNRQESGNLSLSLTSTATSGNEIARYDLSGTVPSGTRVTASLHCGIRFNISGADSHAELLQSVTKTSGRNVQGKFSVMFLQAVAYGSDDTMVGGSSVKVIGAVARSTGKAMKEACGYVPVWAVDDYETTGFLTFPKESAGVFGFPDDLVFSVTAQDVAYYKIHMSVYSGTSMVTEGSGVHARYSYSGDGSTSTPELYADYDTPFTPASTEVAQGTAQDMVIYTSSESLRSGAVITKRMLLSSSHTPAEYMLSFCKIFGLYFTYDNATRKVTVLKRNDLYEDETVDLTRRVDLSKGVEIRPMVFTSKWYDFMLEGVGGSFYDEYLNVEGVPYGMQRVDTGYDFDAESVNLMDSVVYRNACTVLARSRYFNYIFKQVGNDPVFQPSPFVDKGNTYTLWSSDGDTLETDISCPPDTSTVTYYNSAYPGYDKATSPKVEFRDATGKPIDGTNVLLFLQAWDNYDCFKLTDDVPAMDALNDGKPCWLLGAGPTAPDALKVPSFARYDLDKYYGIVEHSLDFGIPRQTDIPGIKFADGCAVYARGWRAYMRDRYDVDTKVMTCRVDFTGIKVSQDLLRKFYWYDNSLWVLNKITNHSLTTYDPVECEFIQVQDKANYLSGQSY